MNKICVSVILVFLLFSCNRVQNKSEDKILTVSIAPFKYFVDEISGGEYIVNVMVPAGADPHVYEPFPVQINNLRKSVAYISNGFLGFEMTWLSRFYEINSEMIKLSLGEKIIPLENDHLHEGGNVEGADPHYWVSPVCALTIASSIKDLLIELNPGEAAKYESNYQKLIVKINEVDVLSRDLFSEVKFRSFMIYHPNLGYLARDYNLEEITVEHEGKEPSPSRMKELIDLARNDRLKVIFVQKEYDIKNAKAIADEINAVIEIIDPLSENWLKSTTDIIKSLHKSMIASSN